MSMLERTAHFLDLPMALFRSEVDSSPHSNSPHLIRLFDTGKKDLVIAIRVREKFVVVEFHHKRDLMRIFAGDDSQNASCRRNSIASSLYGEFYNIFRIEIDGIGGKGSSSRVFNSLIDGENREIACPR